MTRKSLGNKEALINRATWASALLVMLAIAISVKLFRVQFQEEYQGKKWKEHGVSFDVRLDTIKAMRGNIYAHDGSLLATSLPFYIVGLDTKVADSAYYARHLDELIRLLVKETGRSAEYYRRLINDTRVHPVRRYVQLLPGMVDFQQREKIRKWPFFRLEGTKIKVARGGKFDIRYSRYRPFGNMAERTVGKLDPATEKGFLGIEASFNKELTGEDGIGWIERLPSGEKIPIGEGVDIQPKPGADIHTTLDMNLQDIAESSLRKTLTRYQADNGCAIVMEVATGKIRAMVNLGHIGNNQFVENYNHAIATSTDPGSTFKLATLLAVLEETKLDPENTWVDAKDGVAYYKGAKIQDAKKGPIGRITASQVFEKSSNVGIHLLMQRYFYSQPDKYLKYLERFRLPSLTGIPMKGEASPTVPSRKSKSWSKTSLTYMSQGYELRLTPLQMLALYNAVANNGYWVRPMIVSQIGSDVRTAITYEPYTADTPICSAETIKKVQKMLQGVVERGTATSIRSPYYTLAGKTGTAQKLINGSYTEGRYYTSFAGYFPADKPTYSCIVIVDNPKGFSMERLYAGSVAAPVFKEIADRIFAFDIALHKAGPRASATAEPLKWVGSKKDQEALQATLQLPASTTDFEWVRASTSRTQTTLKEQNIEKADLPDVRGMSLRDALFVLENKGFRVIYKGFGKVKAQSLPPSTQYSGPKNIALTLGR